MMTALFYILYSLYFITSINLRGHLNHLVQDINTLAIRFWFKVERLHLTFTHLLTIMMIIACLLLPETPTVTQGEVKGNSWCEGKHKTWNFSNIQSIKCRIVYSYWLGMRLLAPLLSPWYQLLSEATPRTIVGTEGTITVLLPEYHVYECFIILNNCPNQNSNL